MISFIVLIISIWQLYFNYHWGWLATAIISALIFFARFGDGGSSGGGSDSSSFIMWGDD